MKVSCRVWNELKCVNVCSSGISMISEYLFNYFTSYKNFDYEE